MEPAHVPGPYRFARLLPGHEGGQAPLKEAYPLTVGSGGPTQGRQRAGLPGHPLRTSEDERREREAELAARGLHVVTGIDDTDLI